MNILLSVFPILLLFVLMLGVKMAGHKSAFLTLVATLLIAWLAAPALGFAPENYKVLYEDTDADISPTLMVTDFSDIDYHSDGYLQLQYAA